MGSRLSTLSSPFTSMVKFFALFRNPLRPNWLLVCNPCRVPLITLVNLLGSFPWNTIVLVRLPLHKNFLKLLLVPQHLNKLKTSRVHFISKKQSVNALNGLSDECFNMIIKDVE